jgi:cytoskeletal protein RodZ
MKREEEGIRKLFQQLREDDERNAPAFTHDWNVALLRLEKPRRRRDLWRLTAAAIALILLGAGWWMFFRQPMMRQAPVEIVRSDPPPPRVTPSTVSHSPVPVKNPHYVIRRQRPLVRPQPPASLISQWRSPTESLLRTPGEQVFKRVPRLDESLVNINSTIPNLKN